jgi:hypothetical protein
VAQLYLHCAICGRRQADGLLSGAAWGRVQNPGDSSMVRVCPGCMGKYPDWQQRVLASLGASPGFGPAATATR